jgi:hypothetical protein
MDDRRRFTKNHKAIGLRAELPESVYEREKVEIDIINEAGRCQKGHLA